jgi:hypothetical protein
MADRPVQQYWNSVINMRKIETLALAASLSVAGAFAANAATLDFTDLETFTGANSIYATAAGASGKLGSYAATTIWTLTPSKTPMRYNFSSDDAAAPLAGHDDGYDGKNTPSAPLAFMGDGIGIGGSDDEVTRGENLLLTFSRAVKITGIYFLDLFNGSQGEEIADISGDVTATKTGTRNVSLNTIGGYEYLALDTGFTVLSLRFRADGTMSAQGKCVGDDGICDYALAGVEYELAPVPVPAAGLMLLSALGGVAALRRRKQA